MENLQKKNILLIIGGGIAAYKTLDLIRRFRERGAHVRCVMTKAACEFVTPLCVQTLSCDHVFHELFEYRHGGDVLHIQLSREADFLVVAPATANIMAQLASGLVNDLASAVLLASDKPVFMVPAMNPKMWCHPATCRNREILEKDGVRFIGPAIGEMAEPGEAGEGRMSEPATIIQTVEAFLTGKKKRLKGKKIIVTSGPTQEPIDPVRYISNRSSGKQGHALAGALVDLGADVYLVCGPVSLQDPGHVKTIHIQTAQEMHAHVLSLLPADAVILVAAVADWRGETTWNQKIKKAGGEPSPLLRLVENPDILYSVAQHPKRPGLLIGFAAETENIQANAAEKRKRKGADFMIANDVGHENGVVGKDWNRISIVSSTMTLQWPRMSKRETACHLARFVQECLLENEQGKGYEGFPGSFSLDEDQGKSF